jgi:arabinose-5-phosphate isomerase
MISELEPKVTDSVAFFRNVIAEEGRSVAAAAARTGAKEIQTAITLVQSCHGKLALLGVGKSGLIARKIAATFASTGVTAVFVHAADAVHGDLGLLGSKDVVLMFSNSGETDELTSLLPHLDRRGVPLIAIVGNLTSTLARHARVTLDSSVDREACPLNLAPTASTTVALAIGDALAMSVALCRGLTRDDFAVNHPAGRLGKRLTLRVADFVHRGENNPLIGPRSRWREVVIALSGFRLGAVNVVDDRQCLVGLITDGDLRRALTKHSSAELDSLYAENLMTPRPTTITLNALAYDALKLMNSHGELGLNVLPVLDDSGRAVGLLRLQDLVKSGI